MCEHGEPRASECRLCVGLIPSVRNKRYRRLKEARVLLQGCMPLDDPQLALMREMLLALSDIVERER